MDDVLLEGAEKPLDDGVGLGFGHAGVAWRESPETDPVLNVIGDDGAAMIRAPCEAAGGTSGEGTELLPDRPARRPACFEAGTAFRHVPGRERGVPLFHCGEKPDLSVPDGGDPGGIDRPHAVRRFGDDLPVVAVLVPAAGAMGREQDARA